MARNEPSSDHLKTWRQSSEVKDPVSELRHELLDERELKLSRNRRSNDPIKTLRQPSELNNPRSELEPRLLDERDLERVYRLRLAWQRKHRRLGDLPYLRICGKLIRYRRDAIEQFLAACEVK